ncbi:MAG: Succinate-semialdehyde dehydrogenase [NADP(+)] [Chlamydiae bacterium]|nr:Succinate-semialdehyde dehydrogenase [NADP(+)] [Chlamydiota bacterium]
MFDSFFKEIEHGSYVDGEFVQTGQTHSHPSLPLKKEWKKLLFATPELVDQALTAAERGQAELKDISHYERSTWLKQIAESLRAKAPQLAELIAHEMGKPLQEGLSEIAYAASYFDWFAEEAKRIYGREISATTSNKSLHVSYHPVGIVAIITPWNFPIAMGARKIAPALAAGCASIVRPSTDTAVSMLALAAVAKEIGLPGNVLSVLVGDAGMISEKLLASPKVRKFTFTGSTAIGELLYTKCAPTFKKVTLELGGNAPFIVFEDADIPAAVQEACAGRLRVSGQACTSPNRFFIHEKVFEAFCTQLTAAVQSFKIGSPLHEETQLTDTLHPSSHTKVELHIQDALEKGAHLLLKGEGPHAPTILTGLTKEMLCFQEETFGPLFALASFKNEEEVIALANDTIHGLAAYFFTRDVGRAHRMKQALEYGIIGLNDGVPSCAQLPFGGVKYSGFGREGGPDGIKEYLSEKALSTKWSTLKWVD